MELNGTKLFFWFFNLRLILVIVKQTKNYFKYFLFLVSIPFHFEHLVCWSDLEQNEQQQKKAVKS